MSDPRKVYWDSSVILTHLNQNSRSEHRPFIAAMVSEMDAGQLIVYTSVLSITEVAFIDADFAEDRQFASEAEIDKMWDKFPKMRTIPLTEEVAKGARGIKRWQVRTRTTISKDLTMVDIIHMASAMDAKVAEIYTNEDGWSALQRYVKIPIRKPNARPIQGALIPEKSAD